MTAPHIDGPRAGRRHLRPLTIAFILVVVFMVVEADAAFLTGSLAPVSDAGHMATDALGLGMALAARILVQAAPAGLDLDRLQAQLGSIPGVVDDVHDLHVWALTSEMDVATVHLMTGATADPHPVLDQARSILQDEYRMRTPPSRSNPTAIRAAPRSPGRQTPGHARSAFSGPATGREARCRPRR